MSNIRLLFKILLIINSSLLISGAKVSTTSKTAASIPKDKICDRKAVDKCAISLAALTDPVFQKNPPKTLDDIDKSVCKTFKKSETCVRLYSEQCLPKDAQRTLSVLLFGMSKAMKRICSSTKRKQEMLNLFKCMDNDVKKYAQYLFDLSADMHSIRTVDPAKIRVPLTCCAYQKQKTIVISNLEKQCPNSVDFLEQMLSSFTGDLFNYSCGDYTEDSDKCDQIINKIPKWKKPLEWKSFIIPVVDIIESLK